MGTGQLESRPMSPRPSSSSFLGAQPGSFPAGPSWEPLGQGDLSPPSDIQKELPKGVRPAPSAWRGAGRGGAAGDKDPREGKEGSASGPGGHRLPLAQQDSSSLTSSAPWKDKEARRPGSQLQGHESAGSCPGLTPNHATEGGPPQRHQKKLPQGGGMGRKACGARASCFCQWSSESALRVAAGKVPALSSGPRATICTPRVRPHQGPCGPWPGSCHLGQPPPNAAA